MTGPMYYGPVIISPGSGLENFFKKNELNFVKLVFFYIFVRQNNLIMKKKTKHTLLVGEGVHQHTLYGKFEIGTQTEFTDVDVLEESLLKHEHPSGKFGEHQTLQVEKGDWVMGKQVEFNPFEQKITRIWD
jgi:hypothetical protein